LALTGERFVGLVAEDFAEVGNRNAQFRLRRHGERLESETADGGRRVVASHPVKKGSKGGHGCPQIRWVTRVVVIADGQEDDEAGTRASSNSRTAYSSRSSDPATAQALWRSRDSVHDDPFGGCRNVGRPASRSYPVVPEWRTPLNLSDGVTHMVQQGAPVRGSRATLRRDHRDRTSTVP